ncbi:MAG: hypothetical protein GWP19_12605, partial [Planctomycetia bacterium]|nr:hypothetical protein [Planctomycetia bacterium]
MKRTSRKLFIVLILLLFFIGCEDKPLPFEPENDTNENISLAKRGGMQSEIFMDRLASRFIDQA